MEHKLENLKKKFKAFNFNTSVINGQDFEELKKKLLVFKKTKSKSSFCRNNDSTSINRL